MEHFFFCLRFLFGDLIQHVLDRAAAAIRDRKPAQQKNNGQFSRLTAMKWFGILWAISLVSMSCEFVEQSESIVISHISFKEFPRAKKKSELFRIQKITTRIVCGLFHCCCCCCVVYSTHSESSNNYCITK